MFQNDPSLAYAHAWALTFYLVAPRLYADYLRLTHNRKSFADYSNEARMKDFMRVFGNDLKMFDAHATIPD